MASSSRKIPRKLKRILPFLKIIQKSRPSVNKVDLLKAFPQFVTNDLIEIIFNMATGRLSLQSMQKRKLLPHKRKLHELINLGSLKSQRSYVYKQKGGFLSVLIPLITSLLGNLK